MQDSENSSYQTLWDRDSALAETNKLGVNELSVQFRKEEKELNR